MRARTRAVIAPGAVLQQLSCQPPLTLRQVHSDDPDTCALCLVGTAAGPLPGDVLDLEIVLSARAKATLRAAGATLAQGSGGAPSQVNVRVELGAGAHLDADLGALIVAAGASVQVALELTLAADATLAWRETIVLGRSAEEPGAATVRWDVTRGGRPVLRQTIDLAEPALARSPGMLAGRRVLATALVVGRSPAQTMVHSPTAVVQVLADGSALATVLAADAATAQRELDLLLDMRNGAN